MVYGAVVDEKVKDATVVGGAVVDEKVKDATMVDEVVIDEKGEGRRCGLWGGG